MRFIGSTEAKVDSKGRVFLPANFRRGLQQMIGSSSDESVVESYERKPAQPSNISSSSAENPNASENISATNEIKLVMRKDIFEDCLVLYTEAEWDKRIRRLRSNLSMWNRTHQAIMRKIVTDAEWITLDSNGRMLIPKRYLRIAHIDNQVTFVGMDRTIEIWSTNELNAQNNDNNLAQEVQSIMTGTNHDYSDEAFTF